MLDILTGFDRALSCMVRAILFVKVVEIISLSIIVHLFSYMKFLKTDTK